MKTHPLVTQGCQVCRAPGSSEHSDHAALSTKLHSFRRSRVTLRTHQGTGTPLQFYTSLSLVPHQCPCMLYRMMPFPYALRG